MMQGRTFRGQSPDGTWHEGFLIRSPGVKNSRPGEGWYINSEQEPAYAHLVKPFTIGMSTGVKGMDQRRPEVQRDVSFAPHGMGQGRTRHDYGGRGRWPE